MSRQSLMLFVVGAALGTLLGAPFLAAPNSPAQNTKPKAPTRAESPGKTSAASCDCNPPKHKAKLAALARQLHPPKPTQAQKRPRPGHPPAQDWELKPESEWNERDKEAFLEREEQSRQKMLDYIQERREALVQQAQLDADGEERFRELLLRVTERSRSYLAQEPDGGSPSPREHFRRELEQAKMLYEAQLAFETLLGNETLQALDSRMQNIQEYVFE